MAKAVNFQTRLRRDRLSWAIVAFTAATILVFALGCFASYRSLREERQAGERKEAQRLLLAFEAHSMRLFDYADSFLRAIRAYYAEQGNSQKWQDFVQEVKAPHSELFSGIVTVIDRDGGVLYQSQTPQNLLKSFGSMAGLDHYRYFAAHPGDSLFVGATRIGKITGKQQFRLARPLLKNGVFDGIVVITLLPEHITDFYRSLSLGPHSSVTMLTLEPKLIARQPPPGPEAYDRIMPDLKTAFGVDLDQHNGGSVLQAGSPFDGVVRDIFFKRLADYPVALVVGIAERDLDDALAGPRRNLALMALMFTAIALAVCTLALRVIGQNRRLRTNITQLKQAEEELRIAAAAFESQEGMVVTDADSVVLRVNRAFTEVTGYAAEEIVGQTPRLLKSGRHGAEFYEEMWDRISRYGGWKGEICDRRKNGEVYPKSLTITAVKDHSGAVTHYIGTQHDITERKKAEERIKELAFFDTLTGLPNRVTLHEKLAQVLSLAGRNQSRFALMLIDLDNFKAINDTLGNQTGDELLMEVAERLGRSVRQSDLVARLGGDEFVVILPDIGGPGDVAHVAEKILQEISEPYSLGGRELRTSPSIGICLYPDDATESEDLIKQADVAMYHAKSCGRGNYQFFKAEIQAAAVKRLAIEADLRTALAARQFVLHYQPQLDLRSGCLVGVEALIRWQHPERGMVSPLDFIPVAEESGLILPIGDWVLEEACRQLAEWRAAGIEHVRVSVNLAASQFADENLPDPSQEILSKFGLPAESLDLEVTESMTMKSPDATAATMNALTGQHLSLSIDDFGTGYSSLAYLKLFPISTLKIDRSFVKNIETDKNDADICDVTVLLAHKLGLDVVAEGVETEAQFKYLLSIGCEKIQGYLISKPLPADQALGLLRNHRPAPGLGTVDLWSAD